MSWVDLLIRPLVWGSYRGSGASAGAHASDGRAWSWVEGKEDAIPGQLLVELQVAQPRLHRAVEVLSAESEHFGHAAHVEADATGRGEDVALQTRAAAVGHDGDAEGRAQRHHTGHLHPPQSTKAQQVRVRGSEGRPVDFGCCLSGADRPAA